LARLLYIERGSPLNKCWEAGYALETLLKSSLLARLDSLSFRLKLSLSFSRILDTLELALSSKSGKPPGADAPWIAI
jgi:hypothetical protein